MMVTELGATVRLCPIMSGRERRNHDQQCLGSRCMAWCWSHMQDDPDGEHPHFWPDMVRYHDKDTPRRFKRYGFCGLTSEKPVTSDAT